MFCTYVCIYVCFCMYISVCVSVCYLSSAFGPRVDTYRKTSTHSSPSNPGRAEAASLFSLVGGEEAGHAASLLRSAVPRTSEGHMRKQARPQQAASSRGFNPGLASAGKRPPFVNLGSICQACVFSLPLGVLDSFPHGTGPIDAVAAPFIEEAKGTKKRASPGDKSSTHSPRLPVQTR